MKFIDLADNRILTTNDLKKDWELFWGEEPYNHSPSFTTEFFEILMATVNGRNDLEIIGLTPREVNNYMRRMRHKMAKDMMKTWRNQNEQV